MNRTDMNAEVRDLQTLFEAVTFVGLSDGQLLERFIARPEGAFLGALVLRHGAMVWGVCRRVVRDRHAAENAFQATFVVLARTAASVMPREKLGNLLYGVAYQIAMKARARRHMRGAKVSDAPEPESASQVVRDDLADLLDHELIQLPDVYRTLIVLCELEGITHGEAAERLGWPEGTVSGRLSRSKAILARRLTRRGVRLSDGALTVLLAQDLATASSGLPTPLLLSTIKSASPFGARHATAGVVSSEVAALTEEVLKASLYSKIRNTTVVLLASTLAKAGLWQART